MTSSRSIREGKCSELLPGIVVLGLRFLVAGEQFTGTLQQLLLPLAHLDRGNLVIGGDLLECLTTTESLHGDFGLELRAVGAAYAQILRTRLRLGRDPFSWAVPRLEVNDGPCPGKPSTSQQKELFPLVQKSQV